MSKPDRLRVRALFAQAADLPPEERGPFLDAACRGEPDLRAEVEALAGIRLRLRRRGGRSRVS